MTAAVLVDSTTLLGKELRESFERRERPWTDVQLLSTREEEIGAVTEVAGGAALVLPFEADRLQGASVAFFCGRIADTRPLLPLVPPGTTAIILALDATPEDGVPVVMGVNSAQAAVAASAGRPLVSAHPAAALLALALFPLQRFGIEEVVATLVQPASFFDEPGLTELFDQTRRFVALSARGPAPIFGAQLPFNLLPAQGPAEPIAAQLRLLLPGLPAPRLQILQGAVFHSVAASVFVRFSKATTAAAVRKALAAHPYLEAAPKPRHFGPIDAAGSDKLLFGAARQEGDDGVWLWIALDNLTRGGALNALEMAEAIG